MFVMGEETEARVKKLAGDVVELGGAFTEREEFGKRPGGQPRFEVDQVVQLARDARRVAADATVLARLLEDVVRGAKEVVK